jgi:hypothetical protein
MAEKKYYCVSCKKEIENLSKASKFMCPNCGKKEIIRCSECREKIIKYVCEECGFEGPN